MKNIEISEFKEMLEDRDSLEIIDVREKSEYDIIHITDSKLIPMSEIMSKIDEINWDKKVVFICRSGARSGMIANLLSGQNKETINLKGGLFDCYKNGECQLEILKEQIGRYF